MSRARIGRLGLGLALVLTGLTLPAAADTITPRSTERKSAETRSTLCDVSVSLRAVQLPAALEPVCDLVGRKIMDEGGVGALVPPPGWGVEVNGLSPAGEQVFSIETRADGGVLLRDVGLEHWVEAEEQTAAGARQNTAATAARAACTDRAWRNKGFSERDTHRWRFNPAHRPARPGAKAVKRAVVAGRGHFTSQHNDCGYTRMTSGNPPRHNYLGTTSRRVGITRDGSCGRRDGRSVVGFGNLGRTSSIASACTWYRGREVRESDVKLAPVKVPWTTSPGRGCRRAMDIASVMAHETGHTFGLSHPNGRHPALTMNARIPACSTAFRTLGRGDLRGIRAKYGG